MKAKPCRTRQSADIPDLPPELLDEISDAALLVDCGSGTILARNERSLNLPAAAVESMQKGESPDDHLADSAAWLAARRLPVGAATLWLIPVVADYTGPTMILVERFNQGIDAGLEPHRALGIAIHAALGWQWAAVCRIVDDEHFEVLTWIDGDEVQGSEIVPLRGTACEIVLRHERFIYFKDIAEAFDDPEYAQMGARIYAGLTYRTGEARPGHLFALHDSDRVDVGLADTVLSLGAELIGNHLEMEAARRLARHWKRAATVDALTGLRNRHALDSLVDEIDLDDTVSLLVVDLDGLKQVNDRFGHARGDLLLKDFAAGLLAVAGHRDRVFRLGGDEFLLVVEGEDDAPVRRLAERIGVVAKNLSVCTEQRFGASVGIARLAEADDFHGALALADQRMYADKGSTSAEPGARA